MKRTLLLVASAAVLLSGCITQRTASFHNHDYDTVFKGAVAGLCAREDLLVYGADKRTGTIKVQGRGLMFGAPDASITIGGAAGGTPTAKVFPIPAQDMYLEMINESMPRSAAPTPAPAAAPDLDLQRQQLELDKQKLQLEREKLELEKQKQEQKNSP